MIVEIVRFENQKEFKEYAVRFRKNVFHPWRWVTTKKDNIALFKFADAVAKRKQLGGEPNDCID